MHQTRVYFRWPCGPPLGLTFKGKTFFPVIYVQVAWKPRGSRQVCNKDDLSVRPRAEKGERNIQFQTSDYLLLCESFLPTFDFKNSLFFLLTLRFLLFFSLPFSSGLPYSVVYSLHHSQIQDVFITGNSYHASTTLND